MEVYAHIGGQPLGMAFDRADNLYVCIGGMGLYRITPDRKVEKATDETNRSLRSVNDDSRLRLADDLDIADDGRIFFSEATVRYEMHEWPVDGLEARGNGRIVCYDPRNGTTRTVLRGLKFPNGICVEHGGQSILFAETWGCCVKRYWFDGPKTGQVEMVMENLPGFPDNINLASDGNYWLAMVGMRSPALDLAWRMPGFRRRMAKRVPIDEWLFPNINTGCVLKFNDKGEVLETYWDMAGVNHPMITSMREHKGYLYLGGIQNNRIGRLQARRRRSRLHPVRQALGKALVIAALRSLGDRLLGRGEASITIPIFDGALKPNQILDDGRSRRVLRRCEATSRPMEKRSSSPTARRSCALPVRRGRGIARFDRTVTALCALPDGGLAVALGGRGDRHRGRAAHGRRWTHAGGTPFHAVNAIAARPDGTLAVTDGSRRHDCAHWTHDLMDRGASGRLVFLDPRSGDAREAAHGPGIRLRRLRVGRRNARLRELAPPPRSPSGRTASAASCSDRLPVYPSRLVAAAGGGFWLTAFAARTQLVEFVLREPAFRRRMMKEIAPEHWIAPRLRSGQSYPRADAGRASAHHGRAEAMGAAALLWSRDPPLARGRAAILAAQPGRRRQPRHRRRGRGRGLPLSAGQGTGPAASGSPLADIDKDIAA